MPRSPKLMARLLGATALVILPIIAVIWLASLSSGRQPTDRELIDRFMARRADFEKLATSPEDKAIQTSLGLQPTLESYSKPGEQMYYKAWVTHFIGSARIKGYAWLREPPSDLVQSIEQEERRGWIRGELFEPLDGHWFLFLYAYD